MIVPNGFVPSTFDYSGILGSKSFTEIFASLPKNWTEEVRAYSEAANFTQALHRLGCHIVLVTHIPEEEKNSRIRALVRDRVSFDEIYFPFGTPKSSIISSLLPRYETQDGTAAHSIFVDDYMKNILDVAHLPGIDKCFSLNYPFNDEFLASAGTHALKISCTATSPSELYKQVISHVRLLIPRTENA
jgi:hypothetical protein